MFLPDRLRELRELKKLSQGDVEKRTGLLRCYISRVENGHTMPSLETLEKMARALEMPLYQLFYEGDKEPSSGPVPDHGDDWASRGKGKRLFLKLRRAVSKMSPQDRNLFLNLASEVRRRKR